MNDAVCDFRFAICDLGRALPESSLMPRLLPLTPCFSGVWLRRDVQNRFSGFEHRSETAEAVRFSQRRPNTLLKQGVNEKRFVIFQSFLCGADVTGRSPFRNRKSKIG